MVLPLQFATSIRRLIWQPSRAKALCFCGLRSARLKPVPFPKAVDESTARLEAAPFQSHPDGGQVRVF
jgi:hypothetical protein